MTIADRVLVPITRQMRAAAWQQCQEAPAMPGCQWIAVPDATGVVIQTCWVATYADPAMTLASFVSWECLNEVQEDLGV
jgi:hypothetical protein